MELILFGGEHEEVLTSRVEGSKVSGDEQIAGDYRKGEVNGTGLAGSQPL